MIRHGKVAWSRQYDTLCRQTNDRVISGISPDRAYVLHRGAVLNLHSGHLRELTEAERASDSERGNKVILSITDGSIRATDPDTGDERWHRAMPSGGVVRSVDPVVLSRPSTSHNPLLHPNMSDGRDGLRWDKDTTVDVLVLDPRTGREQASMTVRDLPSSLNVRSGALLRYQQDASKNGDVEYDYWRL